MSVVITVFNEETTVPDLLAALAAQTLLPREIIIVDGGSTDNTVQELQQLAQVYPKLHLRVIEKSGNRSVGRNKGISEAKCELIAITDAGCLPEPTWLKELAKCQQTTQADVVAGYYFARPKTPFETAVVPYVLVMPDRINPRNFLPATRSMLLKKNVWQTSQGFDEKLADNEDYAFARRLRSKNLAIAFTAAARVQWLPRTSLSEFGWMIFRFARGDAYSGSWRPKVALIFLRYGIWITLLAGGLVAKNPLPLLLFFGTFSLYLFWSITKNIRYVPQGWLWLPILQTVSDGEVMAGTLVGLGKRLMVRV